MHKTQNIRKLNEFVAQSILSVISSLEEIGTITLLPNIYLSANYQSKFLQYPNQSYTYRRMVDLISSCESDTDSQYQLVARCYSFN